MAPTTPIQLCAGRPAGGFAAVFSDGSSGEYETRARTRRVAKTKTRKPISSLSRRLAVGVNGRAKFIFAFGRFEEPLCLRGLMPTPLLANRHPSYARGRTPRVIPRIDRCGFAHR